jgi:hypothetical protein
MSNASFHPQATRGFHSTQSLLVANQSRLTWLISGNGEMNKSLTNAKDRLGLWRQVIGDRIFYRKAMLACAGLVWHQLAFEYPTADKRAFDQLVTRASYALQAYGQVAATDRNSGSGWVMF